MTASHIQTGKYYKLVFNPYGVCWYPVGSKLLLEDVKDNGLTGRFSCEHVPDMAFQVIDFINVQPWKDTIDHTATSEPICPQCGHIVRDAWEIPFDDAEEYQEECGGCDEPFTITRDITVSYTTTVK